MGELAGSNSDLIVSNVQSLFSYLWCVFDADMLGFIGFVYNLSYYQLI